MTTVTVTIEGVAYAYHTGSLEIVEQTNGRNTLRIEVQSLTGAYRPEKNDEIIVTNSGVRIYGGVIEDYEETGIGGESAGPGLQFQISAVDFNSFTDRRFINGTLPAGTMKSQLQLIEPFLTPYGVTLDPAQATGPTLGPVTCPFTNITEILNTIASVAAEALGEAVAYEIDYNKIFRMFSVLDGSHSAPFNITASSAATQVIGDIIIRPSKTDYANAILLPYGEGQQNQIDPVGVGDGVTTEFTLHLIPVTLPATINVGGSNVGGVITGGTDETINDVGGATWLYDSSDYTVTRTSAPGVGQAILFQYDAQYPGMISVDDGGPLADRVERLYPKPDIFDTAQAIDIANSWLTKAKLDFKEIEYETPISGAHPGQIQTIVLPKHGISGIHLFTRVRIHDRLESQFRYEVTAFAGSNAVPESWLYTYALWMRGSSASSAASVGSVIITGGGGSTIKHTAYLGGSRNTSAQKTSPPSWVPVVGWVQWVCPAGVTSGIVRAEVWAKSPGVSITLRFFDIDADAAVDTASPITTTTAAPILFAVSPLVEGNSHRLEVLASETSDVFAIGSIEYG